jgi:vitamin B12 transporter
MRRPFLTLTLSLLTAAAHAASLSGVVTSPQGQPVPQVVLRLSSDAGTRTVVSGAGGRYRVADLAAGTYRIESAIPGFVLASAAEAKVAGDDVQLDVTLAPARVREHIVVAAGRGEAPASSVGVTTTVIDADQIAERQPTSLTQLLQDVPGVSVNRTGPLGRTTTVFVRGGSSSAARVIVDGVPVNEPGGYFEFGNQLAVGVDQIEVVRGAASSLYGSDGLAGVIEMHTRRPLAGEPLAGSLSADAGSFSFQRYQGALSGTRGDFDWNASGLRLTTDNQGPNSAFEETSGVIALGARLGRSWSLQAVGRVTDSVAGTPGQTAFGAHDLDAHFDRTDTLGSVRLSGSFGRWAHELRVGFSRSHQLSLDPLDSGSYTPTFEGQVGSFPVADYPDPAGYQNNTGRAVAGYKADYQAHARHLLTAGVDVEHETGDLGTPGADILSPRRTSSGVYAQDRWTVTDTLFVTTGGRIEHNDSFGTEVVPRASLSFTVASGDGYSTRLKASAGGGIKEPGFFESFGTSIYAKGNPDLKPERSRTYDAGVEQRAFGDHLRVTATAFRHDYLDQISYTSDPATFLGTYINLGKTRAQGIELEMEAAPAAGLRVFGQYTRLDGKVLVSGDAFNTAVYAAGQPLLRRPKHSASLGAQYALPGGRLSAGATLVYVGSRSDSDFSSLGLTENDGYTRVDARMKARIERRLDVFAIAENLFDAAYQEVLGYPGLGRSLRIGLNLHAGR